MAKQLTVEEIERITPAQFSLRLRKLHRQHQRLVIDAMGEPPDWRNVPPELWQKIRREEELLLLMLILGISIWPMQQTAEQLERTTGHRIPRDQLERRLYRGARQRAAWAARSIVRTTRQRIRDRSDRMVRQGTEESARRTIGETMTDLRDDMIARTEIGSAQNLATRSVYDILRNTPAVGQVHNIWRLGASCRHCKVCPLLAGLDITQWGPVAMIPLHPQCCCWSDILIGDTEELVTAGLMRVADPDEMRSIQDEVTARGFQVLGLVSP